MCDLTKPIEFETLQVRTSITRPTCVTPVFHTHRLCEDFRRTGVSCGMDRFARASSWQVDDKGDPAPDLGSPY